MIYRLTPAEVFTKLATFTIQAAGESNPLVLGPRGEIYGTLLYSGPAKQGSIYQLDPDGTVTILANFPSEGMLQPGSLMLADVGNFYGTTRQIPTYIFRYDFAAGKLERLHDFQETEGECTCITVQGSDGKLYGAAPNGGPTGFGTIFSFDLSLAPPKPRVSEVRPSSGTVGTRVLLWGNNLLGATAVTFNGTPAANPVSTSVQSVYADVPAGATSGPIIVTTPNGSFTVASFTVE